MYYQYKAYKAKCPICLHAQNKLLYEVDAHQAATHFMLTIKPENVTLEIVQQKIASLWAGKKASVVECANCDFTFAMPFVAGDAAFYNLLPHAVNTEATPWMWEFENALVKIKQLSTENKNLRLLEIGASTGGFIKRAVNFVQKENILCLEYSEVGVNSIKRVGIEAKSLNFLKLYKEPVYYQSFDVVCLFQVLEHLDNLDAVFETFNWVLKPGGYLFIGVPNAKKIKFNELNNALLDMPPNHIGRFSKKSFIFLAEKFGLKITDMATEPYTPLDVVKTVMYYQSLQRQMLPPVTNNLLYKIKQYVSIKYLWLQALLKHKQLGETLLVQLTKPH